jgi:hypothetical protein
MNVLRTEGMKGGGLGDILQQDFLYKLLNMLSYNNKKETDERSV